MLGELNWAANSVGAAIIAAGCCLVIGSVIGLINGILIARVRLAPFIVTLGMLEILSGGVNLLNNGDSENVSSSPLASFGLGTGGGWLPPVFLVSILLMVIFGIMLSRMRFGMRAYAIGSNPDAVRRLGVPTTRIIVTQYVLSGMLGGVAGLFLISRFGEATTSVDTSGMLTAIAAVVIGGTSLFGGSGTMFGTFTGVAIVSVLLPGLVLSGLSSYWQSVVTGLVIIAAIVIEQLRQRATSGRGSQFFQQLSEQLKLRR